MREGEQLSAFPLGFAGEKKNTQIAEEKYFAPISITIKHQRSDDNEGRRQLLGQWCASMRCTNDCSKLLGTTITWMVSNNTFYTIFMNLSYGRSTPVYRTYFICIEFSVQYGHAFAYQLEMILRQTPGVRKASIQAMYGSIRSK